MTSGLHIKDAKAEAGRRVKVIASPGAVEFVRACGGRLYVWASTTACCGGARFIDASTSPPVDADRFTPLMAHGFELFVRATGPSGLPDELHVDLRGIRRRRVSAYWNGCAYLL
jgi:hypothetical protein